MRRPAPRLLALAAGLVLAADVATVVVRTAGRVEAADVARSLDRVEGLRLVATDRPVSDLDPCRASAMLLAREPGAVTTSDFDVAGGTGVVSIGVYDFGGDGTAREALRAAYDGLSQCRGFRATAATGAVFRFEYRSLTETGIGAEGYLVQSVGRLDGSPVRTDNRSHLFRRGRLVVTVTWQSVRPVSEPQLRCLAERAEAVARGARARECSAAPVVSA